MSGEERRGPFRGAALAALWLAALAVVFARPALVGSATTVDDLTRHTVWVALAFYVAAVWPMLGLRPADWAGVRPRGAAARWCWTLGWAAYLVHLWAAFWLYHGGSHAAAVRHVETTTGFGPGIYFSHLFTAVWTLDVGWWWLRPAGFASRPAWVGRLVHGYMAFMVVNATVVFGAGFIRWAGVAAGVALAVRYLAGPPTADSMPA